MLEINTGQLRNSKKVLIDGHEYSVRRPGAGEMLAIDQLNREATKLSAKKEVPTAAEEQRAKDIANKLYDMTVKWFDDGGDGTKSRELLYSLDNEALAKMFTMIFNGEPEDAKEASPTTA